MQSEEEFDPQPQDLELDLALTKTLYNPPRLLRASSS